MIDDDDDTPELECIRQYNNFRKNITNIMYNSLILLLQ